MNIIIKNIYTKIKAVDGHIWILVGIMFIGIFLRTYNFHDWLDFRLDQVRDATLVGDVIDGKSTWPEFGPTMRKSGDSKDALFHIGPAYYYFQIISAKIFGNEPDKMAYPDLIFSILSIPLFFVFLKKYFRQGTALTLTALYSFSFFSIQYSRFAWNPNIIPFFVILFLLSLYEFLKKRQETHIIWIISAGIALGIGVQLHAILFILLPTVSFAIFVFFMKKDHKTLDKWVYIFLIAITLNIGQVITEIRTNFSNTKILFNSPVNNLSDNGGFLLKLENAIDCHIEANGYILSSLGQQDVCTRWYVKILQNEKETKFSNNLLFLVGILFSLGFSIWGFGIMLYNFFKERETEKRYFIGLIILFLVISFFIMLPIIGSGFLEFRYFIHTFFVPFMLLGFIMEFIFKKSIKIYLLITVLAILFFLIINSIKIKSVVNELASGNRSDDNSVILGESELMVQYIIANSVNSEVAYLSGEDAYLKNFYNPFSYLAKKQNFKLIQIRNFNEMPADKTIFYINGKSNKPSSSIKGYEIENYKIFGYVVIYKLKK